MVLIEVLLYLSLTPGVIFGPFRVESSEIRVQIFEEMDIRYGISWLTELQGVVRGFRHLSKLWELGRANDVLVKWQISMSVV